MCYGIFEKLADRELLGTSALTRTALDAGARLAALGGIFIVKVICTPEIELGVRDCRGRDTTL